MSGQTGFEDDSLIDLFRSEVETHSESLSAALLALERNPGDTSRIDEMMRAAHSIKGASRVVGVDPAVSVAHVMEDCFVAAQKGAISFSPGDIDVLLRGVDLLGKISAATRDAGVDLVQAFNGPVTTMVTELQGVLSGKPASGAALGSDQAAVDHVPAASATRQETATSPAAPVGEVTIVCPEILDAAAAEVVRGRLLSAIEAQCPRLRLDLRATRDLDAHGLALLAAVPPHLARCGRSAVELAGVSREMATVLRVTGLGGLFDVRSTPAREAE